MLRALLMGAVYAALIPGAPMPLPVLRAELFERYGLDWGWAHHRLPRDRTARHDTGLSRFFATESRHPEATGLPNQPGPA